MKVAGVVLAAGAGVRLGLPKAQVVLDGRRLVNALRYVLNRPDLAAGIEALLAS